MDDVIQQAVAESQQAHAPEPSLADIANADKAGVSPQQGRAAAWSQAVADAQRKFEARGAVQQFGEFAEPMVPFSQIPGISPTQKWKEMVGESRQRIAAGHYTDEDLGRAAYQHVRDEAEKGQGFGRKILGAAGHAAGMIGEAVLTGGVGELIPGASRAAGAARLAATTAAMPSLYGEAANQRAQAQGGSPYDLQNMGPAFAQGMILNKILGSMGKAGEGLVSGKNLMGGIENGYVRNVARLGIGAVQFPAEQQIADNVTSTADLLLPEAYQFKTKYGVLGELVNGSKGEAGQRFAMQAVMGAIFKAVHAPGAEADRKAAFAAELERYNARLESLSRRGMSSQRVFDSATGDMGQERADDVAQLTKQTPAGPQPAPEATPPEPQPAAGGPQPATIAPPAGTSTPAEAPRAPEAIPESENPAAQAPAPAGPAPAPVGAAPTLTPAQIKELAAGLGMRASDYPGWRAKNRAAAEAMEAAYQGRKPVVAESKGATYKPVDTEGPFVHREMEAGGPRLLAEMRAAPEYADIAKAVPEGSKPIGRPNDAFVFEAPDNTIVRVGRASEARPDIPQMIQPLSVQQHGRFKVEVLPKVERVGDKAYFDQHAAELRDAIERLGWKATDLHRDNVGEYQGRPVFIDPSGPRPMTPREREQLAEAQARRKAAQEAPPEEAARTSPPELAAPPAAPGTVLPNGFKVGERVRFSQGGRTYEGAVGESKSADHVWVPGVGNVFKDRVARVEATAPPAPKRPLTKEERTAKMQAGRNRQIRDQAAEKAGVDVKGDAAALDVTPEMYHRAADHYLKLDQADVREHNELLDDAKRALDEYGGAHRLLGAWAAGGKRNAFEDAATIKGIDQAAEQSAKDYPGQYRDVAGDKEHLTDQLFEKLLEGKREVDVAEAYRRAYAEIDAVKEYRNALEDAGKDHTHPEIAEALRSADEAEPRHAPEEEGAPAAPGEADEGNLGAGAADADFAFGANAVDLGAAPTTLVGRLEALKDLTPFEQAVLKNMLAEAAGEPFQSPEQVAKAHAKKGGRATALAAQERLLKRAGEAEGTSWQDVRDAEARSRAAIHGGEADGMGQESREGDLSDQRYKQLVGQAKRGERLDPREREKVLDRMADDIAEKKHAGGDIKADVELYAKIVDQEANDPAPVSREVGGIPGNPGGGGGGRLTALANQKLADERAARAFTHRNYGVVEPLMRAARRSDPKVWEKAMERLGADPSAADKLFEELKTKSRPMTDDDVMLMLYKKINTEADFDRAVTAEMQATMGRASAEDIEAAHQKAADLFKDLDDIERVSKESGSESGRAFRLRRLLLAEDYSQHGMLQKAAHAKGRPLTAEERAEVLVLQRKIADLEAKLTEAEKKFQFEAGASIEAVPKERQAEVVATSPALKDMLGIRAQTQRAKGGFTQQLLRDTAARDPWSKKVSDFFVKLRQAFVISSPKTMAKIIVASAARIGVAPIEEAVGSAIRQLPGIAKIAALAPREGRGFSLRREIKSFASAFTDGMRDAWRTARTGESDLDVIHKGPAELRSWVDFVGDLHAAAKAPAVRAEYTRSFLNHLDAEAAKGVDISNPLVVHKAGLEAYRDSQRAKFQQDNAVVDLYNEAVRKARKPEAGLGMNAAGFGAKILLPVVRVPTNIAAEVGEYVFGTVIGSVKAARAWKLGVETLKPNEAEAIMRQLKKGSIGGAALLAGYLAPDVFGGFYNRDDKRKPGDLQHGEVMTPLGAAPSWTQHNPFLEVFQVGASARRVEDSLRKGKERGTLEGSVAAMLGLAHEVPFVRETTEIAKVFDARTTGHAFGEFLKSLFLPQALQWLAGNLDRDSSGQPIERKAGTVGESIESGVPGLRSNVPLRKK